MKPGVPIVVAALLCLGISVGGAQSAVNFHDLATIPFSSRGLLQLKSVVTDEGSITMAEVIPGAKQAGHHHEQEQIVLVAAGQMDYTIGGAVHYVGVHGAVLTPSNSLHFFTNVAPGSSRVIEYQPVQRIDWQPPFSAYKVIQSPEPVPVPATRDVARDLSPAVPGWTTVGKARIKEFAGMQIRVMMIELTEPGSSIEIRASASGRQFLYVLSGEPIIRTDTDSRTLSAHMVVEMLGSAKPVRLGTNAQGRALVAAFSRLRQ